MVAKKKANRVQPLPDLAEAHDGARRRGEPKSKKPRPIGENPGAALALVHRARARAPRGR